MLLQEHVSTCLKPNIPGGWEEEMEAAGLVLEDPSAEDEEDTDRDNSEDKDISVESVPSDKD